VDLAQLDWRDKRVHTKVESRKTSSAARAAKRQSTAMRRMTMLGVNEAQALPIINLIEKWVHAMGEENTVRRLKDLKAFRLNSFLGRMDNHYVARHRDGTPRGAFRILWKMPPNTFMKVWNCLMVYSQFSAVKITERQWRKFVKGVQRPPPSEQSLAQAQAYILEGLAAWKRAGVVFPRGPVVKGLSILAYPTTDAKSVPLFGNMRLPEPEGVIDSAFSILTDGGDFVQRHWDIFAGVFDGLYPILDEHMDDMRSVLEELGVERTLPYAGAVSVVQEPGYKGRFIANPYRALQAAAVPLYQWTELVCQRITGNYQYDQDSGRRRAQSLLKEHSFASSIDLEGATDNFPRSLVVFTLRALGVDQRWLHFYQEVCGLPWHLPKSWKDVAGLTEVTWTVGQPLGWYPVFNAALSITLGALVQGACYRVRSSDSESPGDFSVQVGDDLVLFNQDASELTIGLLEDLGVPVSKDKTLVSTKACEFCSRLITGDDQYPSYKWRQPSDDNFFDIVKAFGRDGYVLLTRRQCAIAKVLETVPEPWGLGLNPHGLPMLRRLELFLDQLTAVRTETQLISAGLYTLRKLISSSVVQMSTSEQMLHDVPDPDLGAEELIAKTWGPAVDKRLYGSWLGSLALQVQDYLTLLRKQEAGMDTPAQAWVHEQLVMKLELLIPPFILDDLKPVIEEYGKLRALALWFDSVRATGMLNRLPPNVRMTMVERVTIAFKHLVGAW
jgi:hypothetical protein